MKRTMAIILVLFTVIGFQAAADAHFRAGVDVAAEFVEKPGSEDIKQAFGASDKSGLMPGLTWEVIIDHIGFGMSHYVRFNRSDSELENVNNEWDMDFMGSWDFRYHLFGGGAFLDPFAEASIGSAGHIELNEEDADYYYTKREITIGSDSDTGKLTNLSIFSQVGGGLALKLDNFIFGGKLMYRMYNDVPPATQFDPYPLDNFQFSLFGSLGT